MTGIVMPWPASKSSLPPTPRHRAAGKIGSRWAELHGTRSWEGLLDPLDADLRASIIAYGELAQAAYDGFNSEQRSPHAGSCLYSHAELLAASGVSHPEYYTVTKYVYASCRPGSLRLALVPPVTMAFFVLPKADLQEDPAWTGCNWMGFVAVATDEGAAALGRRDIVVAWRGSVEILEYLDDDNVWSTHAKPVLGSSAAAFDAAEVHTAFISVYLSGDESSQHCKTSARDQVVEEVRRLMEVYKDEAASITVTGHSLGAALATLNAVDMVAHGVNVSSKQGPCPVTAFLFACPRVGNESFKSAFASFDLLRALHVKNEKDIVSRLPPQADGWYVDAATTTLPISTTRSPYLGEGSKLMWHNLECYLHCVAGDHGDKGFWLEVDRDIALVNKSADALQDCYPVPANWWVIKNKCLVKSANEHFKLKDITEAIGGMHGLSG